MATLQSKRGSRKTTTAADFLGFIAQGTPILLLSIPNDRSENRKFPPINVRIDDPADVVGFLKTHDVPGRACHACVNEMVGKDRNKNSVAAIRAIFIDVDFKGIKESPARVKSVLKKLKLKPSVVVNSGNGLHCYWCLEESLDSSKAPSCESLMRRICDRLAGDLSVAQVASVLRLPDSHNSKGGDFKLVNRRLNWFEMLCARLRWRIASIRYAICSTRRKPRGMASRASIGWLWITSIAKTRHSIARKGAS